MPPLTLKRVTKRFYDQFKKEHDAFLQFLDGIPDEGMQRWYVSVILNRLMFIYFIQKKGFLDGDLYYLRTKLYSLVKQTGVKTNTTKLSSAPFSLKDLPNQRTNAPKKCLV